MSDLSDTLTELRDELMLEAEASGVFQQEAFFEIYAEAAAESGDVIDLEYAYCRKEGGSRPYRVDGYAFDHDGGVFYIAICDYRNGDGVDSLNAAQLNSSLKQATNFFENALSQSFINSLEDSSPAFEVAYTIFDNKESIRRLRIILFSDARLATKRPPQLLDEISGVPAIYSVLDLSRYSQIQMARTSSEEIEIDLEDVVGSPVPCLKAFGETDEYSSYLLAIPGPVLAEIYGLYGARLLEQNVRTYLQARTKVNKGILATIRDAPKMFFAYNNGLTATASEVDVVRLADGEFAIAAVSDLQIVNGGQTTASILYAKDVARLSLEKVYVQMKLSVVRPDAIERVVPKISRYANTQNRISEADFFSSHPFHLQMERYSRLLAAPPQDGALAGSKWFYERARGQYRDGMAYATKAQKRKYQLEYPREKVLTKTELAKYVVTFDGRPDVVSRGAQKCFIYFAENIDRLWKKSQISLNETWYRNACSMALLFRWTDRMVGTSDWYRADRGHKSQTVTYTLAWLAKQVSDHRDASLDWRQIWNTQDVPTELKDFLARLAPSIAREISNTPDSVRNVGEYCKMQGCWDRISSLYFDGLVVPVSALVSREEVQVEEKSSRATAKVDKDVDFDVQLLSIISKAGTVATMAEENHLLSPNSSAALTKLERGSLSLSRSERNAMKLLIDRLEERGYRMSEIS